MINSKEQFKSILKLFLEQRLKDLDNKDYNNSSCETTSDYVEYSYEQGYRIGMVEGTEYILNIINKLE